MGRYEIEYPTEKRRSNFREYADYFGMHVSEEIQQNRLHFFITSQGPRHRQSHRDNVLPPKRFRIPQREVCVDVEQWLIVD